MAEAKDRKTAAKATKKALGAPTRQAAEQPKPNAAEQLITLSYDVIDSDGAADVAELLAKLDDEATAEISAALSEHWLARSHMKGAKFEQGPEAVKLRAMANHNGSAIDQAAFILGATGVALTPYNLLVEVREIARLTAEE